MSYKKRPIEIVNPVRGEKTHMSEKVLVRRYLRLNDAADYFCINVDTCRKIAIQAGCFYKIDRILLVDIGGFDEYIQLFKVDPRYGF